MWLVACVLHVNTVLKTCIYIQTHAFVHANRTSEPSQGAILTHSQMSRVCTLAFLQPPYLFVFSWRCTALGEQWKSRRPCGAESVSEVGGSGARPGISNRHTESQTEDQPHAEQQQDMKEEEEMLSFKTTQILFHICRHSWVNWRLIAVLWRPCLSKVSTLHQLRSRLHVWLHVHSLNKKPRNYKR